MPQLHRDRTHLPVWIAEERDLQTMLRQRRLAPARRESLHRRLSEVQSVTQALAKEPADGRE